MPTDLYLAGYTYTQTTTTVTASGRTTSTSTVDATYTDIGTGYPVPTENLVGGENPDYVADVPKSGGGTDGGNRRDYTGGGGTVVGGGTGSIVPIGTDPREPTTIGDGTSFTVNSGLDVVVKDGFYIASGDLYTATGGARDFNELSDGTGSWTNLQSLYSGGDPAVVSLGSGATSNTIEFYNFDFDIPDNAVVSGIKMIVDRRVLQGSIAQESSPVYRCATYTGTFENYFTATFNAPNGTKLSGYTPDYQNLSHHSGAGMTFSVVTNDASVDAQDRIQDGVLEVYNAGTAGVGPDYYNINWNYNGYPDYDITFSFETNVTTGFGNVLLFSYSNSTNYWAVALDYGLGEFQLWSRFGGSPAKRASTPFTFATNTKYTIRVKKMGPVREAWLDGGNYIWSDRSTFAAPLEVDGLGLRLVGNIHGVSDVHKWSDLAVNSIGSKVLAHDKFTATNGTAVTAHSLNVQDAGSFGSLGWFQSTIIDDASISPSAQIFSNEARLTFTGAGVGLESFTVYLDSTFDDFDLSVRHYPDGSLHPYDQDKDRVGLIMYGDANNYWIFEPYAAGTGGSKITTVEAGTLSEKVVNFNGLNLGYGTLRLKKVGATKEFWLSNGVGQYLTSSYSFLDTGFKIGFLSSGVSGVGNQVWDSITIYDVPQTGYQCQTSNLTEDTNTSTQVVFGGSEDTAGFTISPREWGAGDLRLRYNVTAGADGALVAIDGIRFEITYSLDVSGWDISVDPFISSLNVGLTGAAIGNGVAVVVGGNSAIYYTTNRGSSWNLASIPAESDFRDVLFDGHKFYACGTHGVILSSADGITWNLDRRSAGSDYLDLTLARGQTVVIQSSDNSVLAKPRLSGSFTYIGAAQ